MNATRTPARKSTATPQRAIAAGDVTVQFVDVTPALALDYLEHNLHNRALSYDDVAKYSTAMREGRFAINGDTIRFAKSGRLIDGQHRLHAVVDSDTTQTMLVVRGIDEDAMITVDVGRPRNVADLLRLERDNPAYVRELATLARRSMVMLGQATATRDKTLVYEYAVEHVDELLTAIDIASKPDKHALVGTRSTYALAAWWLLRTEGITDAQVYTFIDDLGNDIGIEEGSPRHVFRRYVSGDPRILAPTTSLTRERAAVSLFIKTWNAWRDPDRSFKMLRPWQDGQSYPEVETHPNNYSTS
jgi:hypothetical protein